MLIFAFFITSFIASMCDVWFYDARGLTELAVIAIPIIFISLIGFTWVHIDAIEHNYKKSPFLNISIIFFAALAVPYYIYRSRPNGAKAKTLAMYFLLILGYIAISYVGNKLAMYVPL